MTTARLFPLVDEYQSIRLDVDVFALDPGVLSVLETEKRLRREHGYGYVRALWWIWLEDERQAISAPSGTWDAVREIAGAITSREGLGDPELAEALKRPVNAALEDAELPAVDRTWHDLSFACNAALLRRHRHGDCRRLTDERMPARGLRLPTHCFPDGIAYGVIEDGHVVSCAFAHRTGVMEDRVADIGITTAEDYRRRGYAQTCVSAVAEQIVGRGGEARYGCSPDNAASIATARSVGFVPYAHSLTLAAPWPT